MAGQVLWVVGKVDFQSGGCVGLSAPQLGVPIRIMELPKKRYWVKPAGELITWWVQGWAAIIQHEMDHLDGVIYIDKMDPRTFANIIWMEVND
ncbi:LOW QUALITY PROTEIN: peptide deformylase, mitochondrial [Discoglossus pictus]